MIERQAENYTKLLIKINKKENKRNQSKTDNLKQRIKELLKSEKQKRNTN